MYSNSPVISGSKDEHNGDMTNDERIDRRELISEVAKNSDNRVYEFVDLIAKMCAERTRGKKERVDRALSHGKFLGHGSEPFEVHQRSRDESQKSIG